VVETLGEANVGHPSIDGADAWTERAEARLHVLATTHQFSTGDAPRNLACPDDGVGDQVCWR
jgi:hypothetical protein